MSAGDCERWIALTDREAAGESLPDSARSWLAEHARACADCSAEQSFYDALRAAIDHPDRLATPGPTAARRNRRSSRTRWMVGLALAAGIALVAAGQAVLRKPARTAAAPVAVTTRVLLAAGEARLGLVPAEAGQVVSPGQRVSTTSGLACVGAANAIEICLDQESSAIVALGDSSQIVVYLEKGTLMVRLDRQPPGRRFMVRTSGAEAQAVGTRFSVHVGDDRSTRIRLHEGRLAVRAPSRLSTDLAAPAQADIAGDIRVAPMSLAAAREDGHLDEMVELARTASGTPLRITSTPPGADVSLGDVVMGKTPLSMFLAAPVLTRLSLAGYRPVSEWIPCKSCGVSGDGRLIDRAFTLDAIEPAPAEGPTHVARVRKPAVSPDKLLAKAQSLRAKGEYVTCAQLYRRLWSEFPGSEEAMVSMISLGELELHRGKNAASALQAFEAYLRVGGPLDREARFGKIRALRVLGRLTEAEAESASFLRDYPTSIQTTTLRRESHSN
jgi:ferric-dicitrate binding protein FerR (iron transport regulator)